MADATQPTVDEIRISEDDPFVTEKTPSGTTIPAYVVEVPDDYVFAFQNGTMFAPEFRDSTGDKLDSSTRVIVQVASRRGNVITDAILKDSRIEEYDFEEFRTDPGYIRELDDMAVLDEREQLHVYVDVPEGADGFDHSTSNLTIGDSSGKRSLPVSVVRREDIGERFRTALEQNER